MGFLVPGSWICMLGLDYVSETSETSVWKCVRQLGLLEELGSENSSSLSPARPEKETPADGLARDSSESYSSGRRQVAGGRLYLITVLL